MVEQTPRGGTIIPESIPARAERRGEELSVVIFRDKFGLFVSDAKAVVTARSSGTSGIALNTGTY